MPLSSILLIPKPKIALGRVLARRKKYEQALEVLLEADALSKSVESAKYIGTCHLKLSQFDLAESYYKQAKERGLKHSDYEKLMGKLAKAKSK